jgi:transketolase
MGGIVNGLAYHGGIRPYASTFFCFSDYMRGSIRLAALSELPTLYVFTHDSVGVGEDGPTHQPIEHLASLRAMPHLHVFRPADANETVAAWEFALAHRKGPTALVLSRQNLPVLDDADRVRSGALRGGYVLREAEAGEPALILIATGSEVELAMAAAEKLPTARVVSLPCWELFAAQSAEYRESVLPKAVDARVSIEAAATFGWERWIGSRGIALGIDRFGASAPGDQVRSELGLTVERVVEAAQQLARG